MSMQAKIMIVIAIPLVTLICATAGRLVLQYHETQVVNADQAATTLRDAADQVLADVAIAETGVRGYAATRTPLFLAPYHLALTRIGADRKALRDAAIADGDRRQQRAVDATAGRVLGDLAQLRSAVSDGISMRRLRPAMQHQKTNMDLLRRQEAALTAGPTALIAQRRNGITRLETAITYVDLAALILGLLAGLAGVALFSSSISRRVGANAANARRLGEGQPLEPVAPAGDEIGRIERVAFPGRAGAGQPGGGAEEGQGCGAEGHPGEKLVPVQHEPRAANAAELHPRLRATPPDVRPQRRRQ